MRGYSRRGVIVGGAAAAVALLTGAGQGRGRAPERRRQAPLAVVTGEGGFTAPATAAAGDVAFRVHTTGRTTGYVGLAQLRGGATEDEFRARLRRVFETEGAENIRAAREFAATAELFGGAQTHPGQDLTFTAHLEPGRYLVLEFLDFQGARGRDPEPGQEYLRALTVADAQRGGTAPRPAAVLTARDVPGKGPRFKLEGRILPGRPLRYVNAMGRDQVDELVFYPIEDDSVTENDLQAFFDGSTAEPPFDMARVLGTPPLSPGREVIVELPLKPGRYAVATWANSLEDARPLAAHGQYFIITAR
ncbi:hypothetical protein [Streptomyces sp. UG1]|uniref:hypothetical protein n=1 Tax=Streptomyces sp. UG1 TaxID=3417652 RepID=UPI003CE86D8E